MRTDNFMWILTAFGVVAFVYLVFKRIFSFPEEADETGATEEAPEPSIPVEAEESSEPTEPESGDTSILPDYLGDAVRLFKSLTSFWPLFTAGVLVVAIGSAIPLLVHTRGDLHEFVSLNATHDVPSYGIFIANQLKRAFPGLTIVYRAVSTVGTYPLCLFVALDLYLLKGHQDAALRKAAGRYYKLIVLGVIPWAVTMILPLSGDVVFSGVIPATVLGLAQFLLGGVAFALAEGYLFGYAHAFLEGRDDPHSGALRTAFGRFRPLYIFNLIMIAITYIPYIVNGVLMTLLDTYNTEPLLGHIGWLYFVAPIIVVALFTAPPLIVIGKRGVRDSIIGAVRAIVNNPVGYGVLLLAVAVIGRAASIGMGTFLDYIVLPGSHEAYVLSSYLLGTFVRLAASVFCLCILAAYYMRHVHKERGEVSPKSAPD